MLKKPSRADCSAVVRVTLIGQTTSRATKQEQERLSVSATDLVRRVMRVRYKDEQPVAFEQTALPLARLPQIARDGYPVTDLFDLAREHALTLGLARETVRIVRAGVEVAAELDIEEGTRLLKLDRVTFTTDGIPIEWRVTFTLPKD
jgi:GntR family transcriptional regulator